MITTIIAVLFYAFVALLDSFLGAIISLRAGTEAFNQALSVLDFFVYYVRSVLPLTVSTIFSSLYFVFCVAIVLKFFSYLKRITPFVSRFGSNRMS